MFHPQLLAVVRDDPRYAYEAYEFVFNALEHTLKRLGRPMPADAAEADPSNHVSGQQLLEGIRDLALREFGLMARTVFRMWGINQTDDFGEIVFNLIEANLKSKTPHDIRRDFHAVYDLDEALERSYRIEVPQEADEA